MVDTYQLLHQIESANTDELIQILLQASSEEERILRSYFGDEPYERLRLLALKSHDLARGVNPSSGNIVVIHGILGGELSAIDRRGTQKQVWLKLPQIVQGHLTWLRLDDAGRAEFHPECDVRASGILKRYYGALLLSLAQNWTVRAFWFDWRKDVKLAADELRAKISNWFGDEAPVHLVAHSMGGLVARAFMKRHPQRWKTMWDGQTNGKTGGRLVMLGTPNHGSFEIPQVMVGLNQTVRSCALIDLRHNLETLLQVFNSFPGVYQMLPSPFAIDVAQSLYEAKRYGNLNISQRHLDEAYHHHEWMREIADPSRMIYIAGDNQITLNGVQDLNRLQDTHAYTATLQGDGTVSHELGLLQTSDRQNIPTYYVEEKHDQLPSNSQILGSLDELLETGISTILSTNSRPHRSLASETLLEQRQAAQVLDEQYIRAFVQQTQNCTIEEADRHLVDSEARQIEESLTQGFIAYRSETDSQTHLSNIAIEPTTIELRLVCGAIDALPEAEDQQIDAIAVGHYIGVQPQAAELALDQAISRALLSRSSEVDEVLAETQLLLTQYSERGTIRGELGQPFFLNDPRSLERTIAIAGMGLPGRFGMAELTVLARELCWSLGQLGKRHLATVLIGAGNGNLTVEEALSGWIRGIKHGIVGSDSRRLLQITFVEQDPRKIALIQTAILHEQQRSTEADRLIIQYIPIKSSALELLDQQGYEWTRREWEARRVQPHSSSRRRIPTRVTLSFDRKIYRFGAITETASIPEREVPIDPSLVWKANQEMVAEPNSKMQRDRGQFLQQLLIPQDLRSQIFTDAPMVMMLDATTARLHWEIMAHSDTTDMIVEPDHLNAFLGTSRGFTRQLRTTFAPPPEPPPAPRRILNVLIVADPAIEARLPGAEREGYEVANLFESFNEVYAQGENCVKVTRLISPRQATRTSVLRHLMLHSFDVLHFAGHCVYCADDPATSGWIFSDGERLSVNELSRIDRIPSFVFSNACESGITPDRSGDRSEQLAPSFAEAFFAQGVSNFVCTAWPVYDNVARQFALRLYAGMLGLAPIANHSDRYNKAAIEPMYVAMREARRTIASQTNDARTWGAYQHYGNPFFQFFQFNPAN